MKKILLFIFIFPWNLLAQQQNYWPVQEQDEQHRLLGTVGEDRPKGGSRVRHHRGIDINDIAGTQMDIYAIEGGIVYKGFASHSVCIGRYHYSHINPDTSIVNNDDGTVYKNAGDYIGRMQVGPNHVHLQKLESSLNSYPIFDSDDHDWINPLNDITPFTDLQHPEIQFSQLVVHDTNFLTTQNMIQYPNQDGQLIGGQVDVLVRTHDDRVNQDGTTNFGACGIHTLKAEVYKNNIPFDTISYIDFTEVPPNASAKDIYGPSSNAAGTGIIEYLLTHDPFHQPYNKYYALSKEGDFEVSCPHESEIKEGDSISFLIEVCDIRNNCVLSTLPQTISPYSFQHFIVDNYHPYIEYIRAFSDLQQVYEAEWNCSNDPGCNMSLNITQSTTNLSYNELFNRTFSVHLIASERIVNFRLGIPFLGIQNLLPTNYNYGAGGFHEYRFIFTPNHNTSISSNILRFYFNGQDKEGNDLLQFSQFNADNCFQLPMRNGPGSFDNPDGIEMGRDTVHYTEISCGPRRPLNGQPEIILTYDPDCLENTLLEIEFNEVNNEGTINVLPIGGSSPHQIIWDDGDTNFFRSGLSSGTYCFELVDNLCCVLDSCVELQPCPTLITAINTHGHIDCEGKKGKLTVILSGEGIAPYNILWSNGQTTETIENLDPGVYTVTVTDSRDCETSHGLELRINDLTDELNTPDDFIVKDFCRNQANYNPDGEILFRNSYGSGHYYQWTGPNGYVSSEENIYGLEAGVYCVMVTDSLTNCVTAYGCASVNEAPTLDYDLLTNPSVDNNCLGYIDLHILAGQAPFSIYWDIRNEQGVIQTPTTSEDIINALPGYTYQAWVIDDNGCSQKTNYIRIPDCIGLDSCERKLVIDYESTCDEMDTKVEIIRPFSDDADLAFFWSIDGSYSNESVKYHPSNGGSFYVIIKNNDTGCELRKDFDLEDAYFDELEFDVIKNQSICGYNPIPPCDGKIQLFQNQGLHGYPYHIVLNFYPFGNDSPGIEVVNHLGSLDYPMNNLCPCINEGSYYELIVKDDNGCTREEEVVLCCCQVEWLSVPAGYYANCFAYPVSVDAQIQNLEEDQMGAISTTVIGGNATIFSGTRISRRCEWYGPKESISWPLDEPYQPYGPLISFDCDGIDSLIKPGTYTLKVETGCETVIEEYYVADCPAQRSLHESPIIISSPSCYDYSYDSPRLYDQKTGIISCDYMGNQGPYDIYWNYEPLAPSEADPTTFEHIDIERLYWEHRRAGTYTGEIYDQYGCYMETVVVIVNRGMPTYSAIDFSTCTRTITCPGLSPTIEYGQPVTAAAASNIFCPDQIASRDYGTVGCYSGCSFRGLLYADTESLPTCADSEISNEQSDECGPKTCTIVWKCNGDIVHRECEVLALEGTSTEIYYDDFTNTCSVISDEELRCFGGETHVSFEGYELDWHDYSLDFPEAGEGECYRFVYCGSKKFTVTSRSAFNIKSFLADSILCPNFPQEQWPTYVNFIYCDETLMERTDCFGGIETRDRAGNFNNNEIYKRDQFNISPNPFNSFVQINTPDDHEVYNLKILDIKGVLVREWEISGNSNLDLSVLYDGVYIFMIQNMTTMEIQRKVMLKQN